MDSNNNPISNANPAMPSIPSSPAPDPVIPTPSDAMPEINPYVDNTPAPEPATSSVPTFSPANPAANAAPVIPTTSSTPTSFGMNSNNSSFDPSSVASFFTPETPSFSNGGIIAATEPITEPDPIPEPDPIEQELNAPFKAAAPVPGSIGSAVSVPKDAPVPTEAPAPEPVIEPVVETGMNFDNNPISSDPNVLGTGSVVNPNNPFLAQNNTVDAPVMEPVTAPVTSPNDATVNPALSTEPVMATDVQTDMNAAPVDNMQVAPNPSMPQFDPNNPLPMPGDVMTMDPMQANMMDPMMQPAAPDMPFAFDSANNQMNPFAEAAALNTDPNAVAAPVPQKIDNKKKIIIIASAAVGVLLIAIIAIVAMSGGGKGKTTSTTTNTDTSTPTPEPTPTPVSTNYSGTTVCTRKFTDDEIAIYGGADGGTITATIKYKNDIISSISLAEKVNFESEAETAVGLSIMQDNYLTGAIMQYEIMDDSSMTTDYSEANLSITGTRSISNAKNLDAGVMKLFRIVKSDGGYAAEDTIVKYEDDDFRCTEKTDTVYDAEAESNENDLAPRSDDYYDEEF